MTDIDEFIDKTPDDELKELVSTHDKHDGEFSKEHILSTSISTNTWGNAIESDIIVNTENGYTLSHRGEITTALSDDNNDSETTNSGSLGYIPEIEYTYRDRIAITISIIFMSGFFIDTMRFLLGEFTVGLLLNPISNIIDFHFLILLLALGTTLWSKYSTSTFTDTDLEEKLNEKTADGTSFLTGLPDDISDEKQQKLQKIQMERAKLKLRPIFWTMMVTVPIIVWILYAASETPVGFIDFPLFGIYTWDQSVIGPIQVWLLWYLLCSVSANLFLRPIINRFSW